MTCLTSSLTASCTDHGKYDASCSDFGEFLTGFLATRSSLGVILGSTLDSCTDNGKFHASDNDLGRPLAAYRVLVTGLYLSRCYHPRSCPQAAVSLTALRHTGTALDTYWPPGTGLTFLSLGVTGLALTGLVINLAVASLELPTNFMRDLSVTGYALCTRRQDCSYTHNYRSASR